MAGFAEAEGRKRREIEKEHAEKERVGKFKLGSGGVSYQVDKDSSISVKASVGKEDGKYKVRKFGIQFKKEW